MHLTSSAELSRPNLCLMQQYGRQYCRGNEQLPPWLRSQQLAGCWTVSQLLRKVLNIRIRSGHIPHYLHQDHRL